MPESLGRLSNSIILLKWINFKSRVYATVIQNCTYPTSYPAGFAILTYWNFMFWHCNYAKIYSESALFKLLHESTCKIYLC